MQGLKLAELAGQNWQNVGDACDNWLRDKKNKIIRLRDKKKAFVKVQWTMMYFVMLFCININKLWC